MSSACTSLSGKEGNYHRGYSLRISSSKAVSTYLRADTVFSGICKKRCMGEQDHRGYATKSFKKVDDHSSP